MTASNTAYARDKLMQSEIMQAPVVWLASEASNGFNGQRIIAYFWDERGPQAARLPQASAPAAWPQLGWQAIVPGQGDGRRSRPQKRPGACLGWAPSWPANTRVTRPRACPHCRVASPTTRRIWPVSVLGVVVVQVNTSASPCCTHRVPSSSKGGRPGSATTISATPAAMLCRTS